MRTIRTFCLAASSAALLTLLAAGACSSSGPNATADGGGSPGGGSPADASYDVSQGYDVKVAGPFDATSLDDASASTCPALASYATCNTSDPCAPVLAKDCTLLDGIYSLAGRQALTSCYGASSACGADAGGMINGCLYAAAAQQKPDPEQSKLAADFCAACSTGDPSCAADFYSDIQNDAGSVGIGAALNLSLVSDFTAKQVDAQCVGMLKGQSDCGDAFAECAAALLDQGQCTQPPPGSGDAGQSDADPGGA